MIVNNKTLLMLYEQYYLLYNKGGMLPYISEISFFIWKTLNEIPILKKCHRPEWHSFPDDSLGGQPHLSSLNTR